MFKAACSAHVVPSDFLFFDEILYPMRNHVGFKQYNPDKPGKYGILFKSLKDARHCYMYRSFVYAGKPKKTPSAFYVSGMENYI